MQTWSTMAWACCCSWTCRSACPTRCSWATRLASQTDSRRKTASPPESSRRNWGSLIGLQLTAPGILNLWDARTLSVRGGAVTDACAATLPAQSAVYALAVLLDSVVSGHADGFLRVWQ